MYAVIFRAEIATLDEEYAKAAENALFGYGEVPL